ncbi:MAG: hypothetical protein H7Y33_08155, partial [Cytophagales bacterium]|nr:hypothetical protein [Rhizobacter sp.]
ITKLAWASGIALIPRSVRAMSANGLLGLAWLGGAAWLWQFYAPRRGAMFYNMRQWVGVLAGPVVLPALVVLSLTVRLKVIAFSTRDLTAWARTALTQYQRRRSADHSSRTQSTK